ncbi:DUF3299 domain-containing protein [Limnohabitans sp. Rim11]|uniref:DUF3299 domain-containing protein n=1 Tax=Limnohabitans sp. Rim11 TaxID=1100719 RepID=UPI000AD3F9DE|nr:DUF3299 domain-containing protein [Limnohabitans sp. Rim11]
MKFNLIRYTLIKVLLGLFSLLFSASVFAQTPGYQKITWDDLLNEEWYQQMKKDMASYGRMAFLKDGSEEAEKLMASMRKKLDEAPISTKYINQKIRMPGFVVPLDAVRTGQREFLLVPYFGACIHTPPPPANQIVLVTPHPQLNVSKTLESMEVIWVEGELKESRTKTASGVSGYSLEAIQIYPYKALHNIKK